MGRCDRQLRAQLSEEEARVMQSALDRLFEFAVGEMQGAQPVDIDLEARQP
jgi:hypothetical protein